MYRSMFRPLLMASALSLVAATAQADDLLYVQQGTYLNARNGPGTQYAADQVLQPGTQVSVLQRQGDWTQVRTPDGAQAWVFGSYLGDQAPQSGPQAEASANTKAQDQGQRQDQRPEQGHFSDQGSDQARDQRPGQPTGGQSDRRSDARGPGKSGQGPQGQSGQRPQRGRSQQHQSPVQDRPRQVVSQQWAQQSSEPQWTASQSQPITPQQADQ